MTLIKSKINSLAWLKSAIYISVVGGAILSSKVVSAATLTGSNLPGNFTLNLRENIFQNGISSPYSLPGVNWRVTINVDERNARLNDSVLINVLIQHIHASHQGDASVANLFNLDFKVDTSTMGGSVITDTSSGRGAHGNINHVDTATGRLTANVTRILGFNQITDWTLTVNGVHAVPEPATMFGTALAFGWGGWLKRKNSIKQDKTKLQG
jgi:hypothetical protein